MTFCVHGTTELGLKALIAGTEKVPGMWNCSNEDAYFYVWHAESVNNSDCVTVSADLEDNYDPAMLPSHFDEATLSPSIKHVLMHAYNGTACDSPVLRNARGSAEIQALRDGSERLFVLMFDFPDHLDGEEYLLPDVSCDNMGEARRINMAQHGDTLWDYFIGAYSLRFSPYFKPWVLAGLLDHELLIDSEELDPDLVTAANLINRCNSSGYYYGDYYQPDWLTTCPMTQEELDGELYGS